MQVRPLTTTDIPNVLALWRASAGVGLSDADSPENLSAFLTRNPGLSCVSTHDGRLIGAVLVGHDGRRGFLYHLAVHADYRRQGIARRLVARALAGLKELGILKSHVMVFQTNEEGGRFWTHLGWIPREELQVHSLVLE